MSGDKKRVAVTLSPENVEWLDEKYNNRSAFIDDLLTEYQEGDGRADEAVRELRIRQLEEEADELEQDAQSKIRKAERKREKIQELQDEMRLVGEQTSEELSEAREALSRVEHDPTNPAIGNWADKLGMTPVELIEELERDEQ